MDEIIVMEILHYIEFACTQIINIFHIIYSWKI